MALLEVRNLKMYYETLRGYVKAVDDIDFWVEKGEAVGLAGESACGKTSAMLAVLRLLPSNGVIMEGSVDLEGLDLLKMSEDEFNDNIRWKKISVIFQGAMNALHPTKKIGDQLSEPILLHEEIDKGEAWERVGKLLDLVGVGAERLERYPHELSGGLKQRSMIAMSLVCNPALVIADEPTTALDVITQAQVLKVIKELRRKLNLSMILVSHDLSVIAETCDKVAIMYAGKIVEFGDIAAVFTEPLHPYSEQLIAAFPSVLGEKRELTTIHGFPPDLLNPPSGCRFHPRCPYKRDSCRIGERKMIEVELGHYTACDYKVGG
jgi:peptide/nickel transport system ATP-binding protein